jgi:hypothetical protein
VFPGLAVKEDHNEYDQAVEMKQMKQQQQRRPANLDRNYTFNASRSASKPANEVEMESSMSEDYADPKFNHEHAMRANHRAGNGVEDAHDDEASLSFRNQERLEYRSSSISFSKPYTTNTNTENANPYVTLDK